MESGKIVKVDAKEYIESLQEEARKLKLALQPEQAGAQPSNENSNDPMVGFPGNSRAAEDVVDIAG